MEGMEGRLAGGGMDWRESLPPNRERRESYIRRDTGRALSGWGVSMERIIGMHRMK